MGSGGLSDADIEKMVQDAENMRDADTLGYQVEKQLGELKEKMSTADADELKKKLEDLRACMAGEDIDLEDLKKKTADLQEKSWAVTQAAYQQGSSEPTESSSEEKKEDK